MANDIKSDKETVLIVDDTPENIDVLTGILNDEYKTKFAKDGLSAIKIAEKFIPDIILLDIMMPYIDGYEVCKRLKSNPLTKHIPVIFVSAKDQDTDEAIGFELGAVDYIIKPISPVIVKSRVRNHLLLYHQKKELKKEIRKKTEELNQTRLEIIKKLGIASEYKDNETGNHIIRMSKYSYHLALAYGLSEEDADLILNVSPMHDVGKIGVPDYILQKKGKLNPEEIKIMKKHCEYGAKILHNNDELLKLAAIVAYQHHERWDGTGYPRGLKGTDIHLYARIVALADVFDALCSVRPYKPAWDIERVKNHISKESGKHFDPKIVEAFFKVLPKLLEIKELYKES